MHHKLIIIFFYRKKNLLSYLSMKLKKSCRINGKGPYIDKHNSLLLPVCCPLRPRPLSLRIISVLFCFFYSTCICFPQETEYVTITSFDSCLLIELKDNAMTPWRNFHIIKQISTIIVFLSKILYKVGKESTNMYHDVFPVI